MGEIEVKYDPFNGVAVSDGEAMSVATRVLEGEIKGPRFSTYNVFMALRTLISWGYHDNTVFFSDRLRRYRVSQEGDIDGEGGLMEGERLDVLQALGFHEAALKNERIAMVKGNIDKEQQRLCRLLESQDVIIKGTGEEAQGMFAYIETQRKILQQMGVTLTGRYHQVRIGPWVSIDGYCACRCLEGADPEDAQSRVAFIEKTPRVRIEGVWVSGPKGKGGPEAQKNLTYGFDPNSRAWCDSTLLREGAILVGD